MHVCIDMYVCMHVGRHMYALRVNVIFSSSCPPGMQHEGLFSRAISGTKMIVEQYHESVAYALDFICDSQVQTIQVLYV